MCLPRTVCQTFYMKSNFSSTYNNSYCENKWQHQQSTLTRYTELLTRANNTSATLAPHAAFLNS